jgi:hypothetical protein
MLRALLLACGFAITAPLSAQDGAAPTGTEAAPYPSVAILDAFRIGCGAIADQATASASLTAAGWKASAPEARPAALVRFLDFAQSAGSRAVVGQGGTMSAIEVFEQTIAGEQLYVVLSEVRIDGTRVSGCRLFDLGETRPIAIRAAQEWIGRAATTVIDQSEVTVATWEPGALPGHDSFQLFFVPTNSPLKEALFFDGVAFKSDTVGVAQ